MNRKLIQEDKKFQSDIVSFGLSNLISTASVIRDKYKTLGMGDLDNETYQNIVQGGYDYIVKKMVKAIDDALAKANLSLPSIRQGALADVNKRLTESKIEFAAIILSEGKEYKPSIIKSAIHLTGDLLTLEDGKFIVNEEKKERIFDEHTRIYIESEDDQRIWDNLHEFGSKINAQNEIFKQIGADLIKPFAGTHMVHPNAGTINIAPDTLYHLFKVDEDGVLSVKPTAIGYIRGFAQAKFNKEWIEKKEKERAVKSPASQSQKREELYGGKTVKEIALEDMKADKAASSKQDVGGCFMNCVNSVTLNYRHEHGNTRRF